MRIWLNGEATELRATRLSDALKELGYDGPRIATAVNEAFVPAGARDAAELRDGDRLEVVAPRQGG